jgi:serine/threonine protein kinase
LRPEKCHRSEIQKFMFWGLKRMKNTPRTIRFRGREEEILDVISVRGRQYFVLEQLSHRGAFRVFDRRAGINGDYRMLYRLPYSRVSRQRIETLRRLSGPTANRNFPYISDCVRHGDDLVIVMSWVWGQDLRELLSQVRQGKCQRPSVTETVRLCRGLAHGLSHYHRRAQVVHGDVSPANLVLTSGTTNLVLVDFGSAWPVEQSATKDFGDGFTPPYAAPERIARHALEDFRADMFSLSVVAYELLTLEIPYDGAGGRAGLPNLAASFTGTLVPPSHLIAEPKRLPQQPLEQMNELFRVSLAFHPDGRFATRGEWLAAWDGLHFALRKGSRLSGFEQALLSWLESIGGRIWPKGWRKTTPT